MKTPFEMSKQYAKVVQQAYEDGFVQGKIYEQSGRVSCGKTIPKEPKYLYAFVHNTSIGIHFKRHNGLNPNESYIGKIKLEVDDE